MVVDDITGATAFSLDEGGITNLATLSKRGGQHEIVFDAQVKPRSELVRNDITNSGYGRYAGYPPTPFRVDVPLSFPSANPVMTPSAFPTKALTGFPSSYPSKRPSEKLSSLPTSNPTMEPSNIVPTSSPTKHPIQTNLGTPVPTSFIEMQPSTSPLPKSCSVRDSHLVVTMTSEPHLVDYRKVVGDFEMPPHQQCK